MQKLFNFMQMRGKKKGSHKFQNLLISTGVPVQSVLESQTILLKMINKANDQIRIQVFFITDVSQWGFLDMTHVIFLYFTNDSFSHTDVMYSAAFRAQLVI